MNNFFTFFHSKLKNLTNKKFKLYPKRNLTITRIMLGKNFSIHNGKKFKRIKINSSKLGSKLGEFSFTRKFKKFKKIKKN